VIEGVGRVGWDEFARIRLASGEERHGLVLEVDRDLAVVEVLQGTAGMSTVGTEVEFTGNPLRIPVGPGWLGRTCNGRGEPLDGGPPVLAHDTAPVAGHPINPVHREAPTEPVSTGISVVDALTTLVRGQKLPILSVPGLPHLELATQIAAQARVTGEPFNVVFAGLGITHADIEFVRAELERRMSDGELALLLNAADDPVIERILTPRIALTIAEHLAFSEGGMCWSCSPISPATPKRCARSPPRAGRSRPGAPTPAISTATWPRCSNGAASSAAGRGR